MNRELNIPFKGSRDYLQSSNIWDAVADEAIESGWAKPAAQLDLVVRRRIQNRLAISDVTGQHSSMAPAAEAILSWPGGRRHLRLRETTGAVMERIEDPEEELRVRCRIGADSCAADGPFPFSGSQVVVALTKFLHEARVDGSVKWLATRLALPLAVRRSLPERVTVTMSAAMAAGTVASVALVMPSGEAAVDGRIFFHKSTW